MGTNILCRNNVKVQEVTTAVTEATNGSSYLLIPGSGDGVSDGEQAFRAYFSLTVANGTSPTLDAKLQTSWDGSTWVDVVSAKQLVGAGSGAETKDITAALGPYVRGVLTPGGTAAGDSTCDIRLLSTAPFSLKAA